MIDRNGKLFYLAWGMMPLQINNLKNTTIISTRQTEMDITQFVTERRDSALLLGDYNSYRAQLSRRIVTIRRKLGRTTSKNAKYAPKPPITAEEIGHNHEYRFHSFFVLT